VAGDARVEAVLRSGHDLGIHELSGVEIADQVVSDEGIDNGRVIASRRSQQHEQRHD